MEEKLYFIDKVFWLVDKYNNVALPICPTDYVQLSYLHIDDPFLNMDKTIYELKCEECGKTFKFKRSICDEKSYVIEKILALDRKKYEKVDIDGMQTPVIKKHKIDLNSKYFCTTQIRESKRGPQIVIYAGKKGSNKKSQIFISDEERRLSFDQNDINPTDIFTKIVAEFRDGTKHTIEKT